MKKTTNNELWKGMLFLLWLLLVFSAYMVTHKPFAPQQALNAMLVFWRIALPCTLVALAGGIGLLAKLERLAFPPLVTAALSAALGVSILSLYFLIWGAVIGINLTLFIVPVFALFFLRKNILAWLALWTGQNRFWHSSAWIGKFIFVATLALFALRLFAALAPPLEFDSLTYHFSLPLYFIQSGKIQYDPHLMFWGMPLQIETLYIPAMLLGGAQSAAVLSWLVGVVSLAGLLGLAEKYFGVDAAWMAVAGVISGVTFVNSLGSGYVEWATFLFGLAALACLIQWAERQEYFLLAFAGVFAGLALSVKYTSGIILLTGFVVLVVLSKKINTKDVNFPFVSFAFKNFFVFGFYAAIVFSPWLIKNFIATGNPVYPLIFPTQDFDSLRMEFYNFAPLRQDWLRLILLPWLATAMGREGGEGYSASIGAALLGFSPLALIFYKKFDSEKQRVILISATFLATGFLTWAIASQFRGLLIQTRLYASVFPAWALLCAAGFVALNQIKTADIRFGNIASALVAFALIFVVHETTLSVVNSGAINVVFGIASEESFLERNTGEYKRAMDAVNALPSNARVIMLWETRGYYCLPRCDSDEIIDRWRNDWRRNGDLDALIQSWRKQGYTHVLLRKDGMNFIRKYDKVAPYLLADWQALDALLARLNLLQEIGESYALFSLE